MLWPPNPLQEGPFRGTMGNDSLSLKARSVWECRPWPRSLRGVAHLDLLAYACLRAQVHHHAAPATPLSWREAAQLHTRLGTLFRIVHALPCSCVLRIARALPCPVRITGSVAQLCTCCCWPPCSWCLRQMAAALCRAGVHWMMLSWVGSAPQPSSCARASVSGLDLICIHPIRVARLS